MKRHLFFTICACATLTLLVGCSAATPAPVIPGDSGGISAPVDGGESRAGGESGGGDLDSTGGDTSAESALVESGGDTGAVAPEAPAESGAVAAPALGDASGDGAGSKSSGSGGDTLVLPMPTENQFPVQSGLLTAGDVDDNLNYNFFLRYLNNAMQSDYGQSLPEARLRNRIALRISDEQQNPLANARLRLFAQDQSVAEINLFTGANGLAYFYPNYFGLDSNTSLQVLVETADGKRAGQFDLQPSQLNALGQVSFTAQVEGAERVQALDVALVIDTTGSMGDELEYLTTELEAIVSEVNASYPNTSIRFALVVYRDIGDEYVVRSFGFTERVREMRGWLEDQYAGGGGDYPEAMEQALNTALELNWRGGQTSRVLILNADAPPHDENLKETIQLAKVAAQSGIRIYPLAASGVADTAEYVMRILAATTGGRYLFLTDDSGVGNEHAEPKIPCYVVTRLDQLMVRILSSELSGQRVEARPGDIIRTSGGEQQGGVCYAWQ